MTDTEIVSVPEYLSRIAAAAEQTLRMATRMKELHLRLGRIGNANPVRLARAKGLKEALADELTDEGFAERVEEATRREDPLSRLAEHLRLLLDLADGLGKIRRRAEKLRDRKSKGAGSSGELANLDEILRALSSKEAGFPGKTAVCLDGYASMRRLVLDTVVSADAKVRALYPAGDKALRTALLAHSSKGAIETLERNEAAMTLGKLTRKGARA